MNSGILLRSEKPYCCTKAVWLSFLIPLLFLFSCSKDETVHRASLILKTGQAYTKNNAAIPVGGSIRIGVLASGAGSPLTYIRISRICGNDTTLELDRGFYAESEGLDADYTFAKDTAVAEQWVVMVMNADRDTAMRRLTVLRGEGTAYGPIKFYASLTMSFQNNQDFGHYLDAGNGLVYDNATLTGHEASIDIVGYYYITSGLSSPTLTCPGYTAAVGYYPELSGWPAKRNILYDYYSSDNDLVDPADFDKAVNDSLLINAYRPDKVSGNCKYCYTGRVIPFKTEQGKYGLIKVIRADESESGTFELAVKIQQ